MLSFSSVLRRSKNSTVRAEAPGKCSVKTLRLSKSPCRHFKDGYHLKQYCSVITYGKKAVITVFEDVDPSVPLLNALKHAALVVP